jgi:hypothetical protein
MGCGARRKFQFLWELLQVVIVAACGHDCGGSSKRRELQHESHFAARKVVQLLKA